LAHDSGRKLRIAEGVNRSNDRQAVWYLAVGRMIGEAIEVVSRVDGPAGGVG
jgi:hypothetical protein